jgi:two-component system OmpR family sensor kinase
VFLTLIGLTVAGAATYGSLRSFMSSRIDDQLDAAFRERDILLPEGGHKGPDFSGSASRLVGLYDLNGALTRTVSYAPLPGKIVHIGNRVTELRADGVTYRLRTGLVEVGGLGTQYLAVGVPLTDMNATLTRLLWLELAIGTLALAAAAAIGWRLVRVAMKPLEHIEATAGAIAEGDLTQRVADEDRSTEVGRLGHSLNVMLGRIEESFAEREASEKRLRQFVADASHELQTPLTSVRGYAELFRRGAVDRPEDLANAMRRIEAESERMGVLVDDLLLLARLDQGRPLIRERVDLGAAARELAGDAQIVSQDHPIDVTVDGDVTITGDGVRLRQIISNLLSNARTHTPPGTAITVSVRRMGRDVLLEVADTGPGLSSGHLERVFERFFRADPSRARTSGGTGLGLSIVAAIARAHGGEAGVASAPGDGATFHVRLPVDGPSEPVDQLQLPEDDEQAETPS